MVWLEMMKFRADIDIDIKTSNQKNITLYGGLLAQSMIEIIMFFSRVSIILLLSLE